MTCLGISQATAYRYLDEAVGVLAARAPDLHDALQRATTRAGPLSCSTARSSTPTGCGSRS